MFNSRFTNALLLLAACAIASTVATPARRFNYRLPARQVENPVAKTGYPPAGFKPRIPFELPNERKPKVLPSTAAPPPAAPAQPEQPFAPEQPESPFAPEQPEQPFGPEQPESPFAPEQPPQPFGPEQPAPEQPEIPAQPEADIPAGPEGPEAEVPVGPAPEAPAPEAPAPEGPAPEAPAPEVPAPEAPVPEAPAPEAPAPEAPVPEGPTPKAPAPEAPATEIPAPAPEGPAAAAPELPIAPAGSTTPAPEAEAPAAATPAGPAAGAAPITPAAGIPEDFGPAVPEAPAAPAGPAPGESVESAESEEEREGEGDIIVIAHTPAVAYGAPDFDDNEQPADVLERPAQRLQLPRKAARQFAPQPGATYLPPTGQVPADTYGAPGGGAQVPLFAEEDEFVGGVNELVPATDVDLTDDQIEVLSGFSDLKNGRLIFVPASNANLRQIFLSNAQAPQKQRHLAKSGRLTRHF